MPLILSMKKLLCLLPVLFLWSQPAEAGVEIQNYNTQTPAEICQLSTCEHLLKELEAMHERMEEMESKLHANNYEIEELQKKSRERPKVAFAAALGDGGHVGPSNTEDTLAFKRILTNVGNAYNASSGVFIVPVKGVYYVSISTFKLASSEKNSCVSLFRNDQRLLTACDHASGDSSDSAGNGAPLLLEQDDRVYVTLHAQSVVFDDFHNRSCFRGFLVFQM